MKPLCDDDLRRWVRITDAWSIGIPPRVAIAEVCASQEDWSGLVHRVIMNLSERQESDPVRLQTLDLIHRMLMDR
jgi:hypothetical protein